MNAASSRSHAVFTIWLSLRRHITTHDETPGAEKAETLVEAKFHLADLAGRVFAPQVAPHDP
jgi:hypothetical protein